MKRHLKPYYRAARMVLCKMIPGLGLNQERMVRILNANGIGPGSRVMVHSSLFKIGYVAGGPEAVVAALKAAVTKRGTLAMPAFSSIGSTYEYVERHELFDVSSTPSRMGAITECFRTSEGVFRSMHPTHSLCFWGADAEALAGGWSPAMDPFWNDSWRGILEEDFRILLLGVDFESMPAVRILDDLEPESGPDPYLRTRYELPVRGADGQTRTVETKVHNPRMSVLRQNRVLYGPMMAQGLVREFRLGEARCMMVKVQDVVKFRRELDAQGVYTFRVQKGMEEIPDA